MRSASSVTGTFAFFKYRERALQERNRILEETVALRTRELRIEKENVEIEQQKSEKLLLNILPKDTADELKLTGKAKAKSYGGVTVLFTDFKGFTTLAEKMSAEELVSELDYVFKNFDKIISKFN